MTIKHVNVVLAHGAWADDRLCNAVITALTQMRERFWLRRFR